MNIFEQISWSLPYRIPSKSMKDLRNTWESFWWREPGLIIDLYGLKFGRKHFVTVSNIEYQGNLYNA
jgi:hypothetical protein